MAFEIRFRDGRIQTFDVLRGADLRDADLRDADLRSVNLQSTDLRDADLRDADLRSVNLQSTDLRDAILGGADLHGANLRGADLHGADLHGADLSGAILIGADLHGADLHGADLRDAKLPHFQICPVKGSFRGYKRVQYGEILELEIPEFADRTSTLVGRKCRASAVRVLQGHGRSFHDPNFVYVQGELAWCDDFDPDIRVECTRGIHFFLTREEAEAY